MVRKYCRIFRLARNKEASYLYQYISLNKSRCDGNIVTKAENRGLKSFENKEFSYSKVIA